ncbi:hypothetical protein GCM10022389_28270 [Flavobacterium cheonanense]|uniref:Uncharacterized protein n=1 Tax=Flavobacterium cheonanense TaxID=706183 RepID=A0ABP7W4T8_9FLAO
MKEKIVYLIHTEYHLLLSINDILQKYSDTSKFEVQVLLKQSSKSTRLKQDLDLNFLPFTYKIINFNIDLNSKLTFSEKEVLEELLENKLSVFIFFQEQDPISIILINKYVENKTKIYLYQDGLKPYVINGMKFSLGMVLYNIKQNQWIKKNGYSVKNYFSFLICKRYGYLRGIDKLFLSFPNAYTNWNNLPIEPISTKFTDSFKTIIKQVFHWDSSLLCEKEGVIFFMNQPMNDDGSFEVSVLKKLKLKYPKNLIYIKNHPLTSKVKLEKYKELDNIIIINSKIPAELFISELKNSIILSICSTATFINNEDCKFYWIDQIMEDNNVERLKRYNLINPTPHVITVKSVNDIVF